MRSYPISLTGLERRRALVIGGGTVAERKVAGLLAAGARVAVVSPQLTPELEKLALAGQIDVLRRVYQSGDLAGASLVVAATGDVMTNQAVWQDAEALGLLINVVDDPAHSNFIMPAVLRRGALTVAVSTGGGSPALARRLRDRLEPAVAAEYEQLVDLLADMRPLLAGLSPAERTAAAYRLVDSDLLDILRQAGPAAGRQRALELLGR